MDDKKGSNDKKITINIKALNKGPVSHTFNTHEKVRAILEYGVTTLGLDRNPPKPYELFLEENARPGRKLQLDATIAAERLKDSDSAIILAPSSPDGARCDVPTNYL